MATVDIRGRVLPCFTRFFLRKNVAFKGFGVFRRQFSLASIRTSGRWESLRFGLASSLPQVYRMSMKV